MHIVEKALRKIDKNLKTMGMDSDITENDIKLARVATLLHDVGHYPFSHALEGLITDEHEKYSSSLVENVFVDIIEKANIEVKDVTNLILGKPPLDKPFLRSLINGQLDVDKFDYLLRDSHYTGVKYGIYDLDRLDSLLVKDKELAILEDGF